MGKIDGKSTVITIDSGAHLSLINKRLTTNLVTAKNDQFEFVSANKKTIEDEGFALVPIQIGNLVTQFPMVIVENSSCEVLLGLDFYYYYGVDVRFKDQYLKSQDIGIVSFNEAPKQNNRLQEVNQIAFKQNTRITVQKKTYLPPRTKIAVPICTVGLKPNHDFIIKGSEKLYRTNRILVPNMLLNANTKMIVVINPSTDKRWLSAKTKLGHIEDVYIKEDKRVSNTSEPMLSEQKSQYQATINLAEAQEKLIQINPELPSNTQTTIKSLVQKYYDVFAWDGKPTNRLTQFKYTIHVGDHPPIKQRPYPASEAQRKLINEHVDKMLDSNVCEPSESPWASPCALVPKKDGFGTKTDKRFIIDFREVNKISKISSYPLPRIDDILNRLRHSTYFSTLDWASGYWQIPLDEKSKEISAFITQDGLYQFTVLPFGVAGGPACFTKIVDLIMSDLKYDTVLTYIDDIIVYSQTEDEHIQKLEKIFIRLQKEKVKLQPKKCHFMFQKLKILGYIISKNGIEIDPNSTAAVKQIQPPRTWRGVRKLLGFFSYFRRFIQGYCKKVAPFSKL